MGSLVGRTGRDSAERMEQARAHCDRAKEALLAGYFGGLEQRPVTDLEATQVLWLLVHTLMVAGFGKELLRLMELGIEALDRVCPLGTPDMLEMPLDPEDWVVRDSALRLWIVWGSIDVTFAYLAANRTALRPYFTAAFALPAHEVFFDHEDPEKAHAALLARGMPPAAVDFASFAARPSADAGATAVRSMIAPVFEVRASFLCVLHTTNFCRHLRHRLRSFATARGISAVTMLTKDPADFTPDEAAYRSHVNMFDAVVAAFYASLPPDAGPALRDGDPFPLFSGPWFRTPAHGHLFATWSIPFYTYAVEHHLGGDPRAADPSIFRSQGFVAVLDGCVAAARLFRAQIRADPELRCAQFSVLYDLLKVAAVNFAAANLMPPGEAPRSPFAQDLAAVSRYVDGIAANYGPVVARTAANLRRSVAEAGIDLGAVGEEGEVPGKLGLLRFRKVEGDPGSALAISVASVDEASRKFAATEMAD